MPGLIGSVTDFLGLTNMGGQEDAMKNAIAQFNAVNAPQLTPIELQQLVSAGQLTPEAAQTYLQQQSEMQNVAVDPKLRQAQYNALQQLQDVASQQGMTAQDKALQYQIQQDAAQKEKAARDAVMMNAAQRGISGSGLEMLGQMQAQQGGANAAAGNQMAINAQAQQRALAAMQGAGQMGGQMEQAQFGEQSAKAQAQDAINRYNAMNQQQQANAAVNARNQAQAYNLSNAQNIANTNVGLRNQQTMYNASIPQQQFANQMALASGRAGQYQGLANVYGSQAAQVGQGISNAGSIAKGIGQAFGAEGGAAEDLPTPDDASDILEKLTQNKIDQVPMTQQPGINPIAYPAQGGGGGGGGGMGDIMKMLPMLAMAAKDGGKVPGPDHYRQNSLKHDVVPAMLSPGEIVVPNSHAHNKARAHAFVDKVIDGHEGSGLDTDAFLEHITGYKFKIPEGK